MARLSGGEVSGFEAFNLGTGKGYSVKEVIDTCRRVTGQDIRYRTTARRAGAARGECGARSRGTGLVA